MATATLTAPTFTFAPGKTWFMPVTYLQRNADGTAGAPVNLTGGIVSGILFARGGPSTGIPLTIANGGVTVDLVSGAMNFLVNEFATAGFVSDTIPPFADYYNYPTRLEVDFRDSLGHLDVAAVFPIHVFDPRFVDPATFPLQQFGTIVSGGPQGLPGVPGTGGMRTIALPIAIAGQTAFAWPGGAPPANLDNVTLIVDGLEFNAPAIIATPTTLSWAGPAALEPSDTVFLRF